MDASLTTVAYKEVHRKYPSPALFFPIPVKADTVSKFVNM